jgi:3-deoxy-D-manno-octulosonic-acid transferase
MWLLLYSIVTHSLFILGFPWIAWSAWKKGKLREGIGDRFGFLKYTWIPEVSKIKPIWIHAVSVGEAQMLPPVLKRLASRYPGVPLVVSTNTVTGQNVAKSLAEVSGAFFVPLDFSWTVKRVLNRLSPRLVIILETEIWPQLIVQSTRKGIPVIFLNGRIGDKSFRHYQRIRFFLKTILQSPFAFGMRSSLDADRIVRMGAPVDKVHVLGNLKYESAYQLREASQIPTREQYGLAATELVLVGGSTFPGEEELLLRIYTYCRHQIPSLRLILAPRHPERFDEVAETIMASRSPLMRISNQGKNEPPVSTGSEPPIILLDVMGQLKWIYSFADLVFIGKSMALTEAGIGGQNPLEPAAWSKPVVCGAAMGNFEEVIRTLIQIGGARMVAAESALQQQVLDLLTNPAEREQMGWAAFSVIESSLGAADRCLELVDKALHN